MKGDPYLNIAVETTALLRKKLKLDDERLIMTFQSRFGTAEVAQALLPTRP